MYQLIWADISKDLTILAAWYAALVSTLSLGWNIFVWHTKGPKLKMTGCLGTITTLKLDTLEDNIVILKVTNAGDAPSTITTFALEHHKNKFWWLISNLKRLCFNKHPRKMLLVSPWQNNKSGCYKISPSSGETICISSLDRQDALSEYGDSGIFIIVAHSIFGDIRCRIKDFAKP